MSPSQTGKMVWGNTIRIREIVLRSLIIIIPLSVRPLIKMYELSPVAEVYFCYFDIHSYSFRILGIMIRVSWAGIVRCIKNLNTKWYVTKSGT